MIDSIIFWGALALAVALHCLIEYNKPSAQYRRALRKAIRVCNRAYGDMRRTFAKIDRRFRNVPRYSTGEGGGNV